MDNEKEVNNVVSELRSGRGSSLYGALIMLRTTLIKSRSALTHLIDLGAVKLLVSLLEQRRRHVNGTKTADIVMSILANMCMEDDVREKIVSCDGLSVIARVTLSAEQESIQNRGIRALANLAQDAGISEKIVDLEIPVFVAKRLMETEDEECRSTYCRALQLFAQTSKGVKRLLEDTQAVQALAALLKLDNRKLALKSLRVLSELSASRCCSSFSGQILAANILEELVSLSDDDDSSAAGFSLSILLRLCEQELMRPALGSAGVISHLIKLFNSNRVFINKVSVLNALCLCTKEAVNRNKIRDAGALQLFMTVLKNQEKDQFTVLHDRIISSLVNFLYNEDCLSKLLELGLVKTLTQHLKKCCHFSCTEWDGQKDMGTIVLSRESEHFISKTGPSENSEKEVDIKIYRHHESVDQAQQGNVEDDPLFDSFGAPDNSGSASPDFQLVAPEGLQNKITDDANVISQDVDPLIIDSSKATDSTGMIVDDTSNEPENAMLSESSDQLPLPPTTISRHTFSINSPTYQAETSWRMEDYTSGVTCKDFSQGQEPVITTPPYQQHFGGTEGMPLTPYSPLSAGASYYSPAQSSPARSAYGSPLRSTSPHSLASSAVSAAASPAWLLSSPESSSPRYAGNGFSPQNNTGSQNHHSPVYQNQFSPLSNTFPASPLQLFEERDSQSPLTSSQTTTATNSNNQFVERLQDSPGSMHFLDYTDQIPMPKNIPGSGKRFAIVPLSQDSATTIGTPVYSASEDEDSSEDDNGDSDLKSLSQDQQDFQMGTEVRQTLSDISSADYGGREVSGHVGINVNSSVRDGKQERTQGAVTNLKSTDTLLVSSAETFEGSSSTGANRGQNITSEKSNEISVQKRHAAVENSIPKEHVPYHTGLVYQEGTQKRRKLISDPALSNTAEVWDQTAELCHTETIDVSVSTNIGHSSSNSIPSDFTTTERKNQTSLDQTGTTLLVEHSFGITVNCDRQEDGSLKGSESFQSKEMPHLQDKTTTSIHFAKHGLLQRMSSFPGRGTLPEKLSTAFGKHPPSSEYPITRHDSFSCSSAAVFSRHGSSPLISDSPYRSPYTEYAQSPRIDSSDIGGKAAVTRSHASYKCKFGDSRSTRVAHAVNKSEVVEKANPTTVTPTTSTSSSRTVQETDNIRLQKIRRTTESNILILLARISTKTNPAQFLAETSVLRCLLGYMASAPNPIRRCCRILYRLCSNPLSFDKLVLLQMPVLLVKSLVFEHDGSIPDTVFPVKGESRIKSDLFPSSQGSEGSSSQASEFGKKMDFEFGGDAYSRMMSRNQSGVGAIFRDRPSISVDSQSARDASHGSGDIYDTSSTSRKETRVLIGLELLHAMAMIAISPYGEGEIEHILARHSLQGRLACTISLLHLRIGWDHFARRQFTLKYKLCDRLLPYLLMSEAPLVREAIVAGISVNLHLDKPSKQVKEIPRLMSCSDHTSGTTTLSDSEVQDNAFDRQGTSQDDRKCSSSQKTLQELPVLEHSKKGIRGTVGDCKDNFRVKNLCEGGDKEMNFKSGHNEACPYLLYNHDVHFIVQEGDTFHKLGVRRKLMIRKSEVFAAMLSGAYIESKKTEIELCDVNCDSFEFIIHYLHGCVSGCPIIDSLSLADQKSVPLTSDSSMATDISHQTDVGANNETHLSVIRNLEEEGASNPSSQPEHETIGETCGAFAEIAEIHSGLTDVNDDLLKTPEGTVSLLACDRKGEGNQSGTLPMSELSLSEDPLNSVSCESKAENHQSVKTSINLQFQISPGTASDSAESRKIESDVDVCTQDKSERLKVQRIVGLINKCADILAMADRFLLTDLMAYPTSVLSHVCLCPYTAEEIFRLACFYKIDALGADCIREILLSHLPSAETAAVFVDLAQEGYKEQMHSSLMTLLNCLTL